MERTCSKCREVKSLTDFYRKKGGKDGLQPQCKPCVLAYQSARQKARTPEKIEADRIYSREYQRRGADKRNAGRHGLTEDEFHSLLKQQNDTCLACDAPFKSKQQTSIDHDHQHCPGDRGCPECIRGIICLSCNLALGHLGDDLIRIEKLHDYLAGWQAKARKLVLFPDGRAWVA